MSVAVAAVGLGTAIGLVLGQRAMGVARMSAAVVALAAVCFQLLPDAVSEVGWWALGATAIAIAIPVIMELAGQQVVARQEARGHSSLEFAYVGLLVHQLGDGLALGALGSGAHDHGHEVSIVALAIHAVALSAVFVLAFRQARGVQAAVLRAAGMAATLVGGALLVGVVPATWLAVAHPWVAAATGGLLLHVALHPLVHPLLHRRPNVAHE
ncbi:MAG: hypothetical protein AB8H79_23495 [Myxococcota bacterium]